MSELEEKLSALMSNPQLMQQIAAMAQSIGSAAPEPQQHNEPLSPPSNMVPDQIQSIFQSAGQNGVDRNQQALLHALTPYLSTGRIHKLERAMRAAKMAGAASMFLNAGGLQLLTGR